MKSKLRILPILIIMTIILQFLLPLVSNGAEVTLNVVLKRDEINPNQVNITATDTQYNIEELKYVHKRIEKSEINYFEEDNDDVYTLMISPSKNVEASFMLDGYGTYTVYARNSHGDRFLSRITINDPGDLPDLTLTRDDNNPLSLTIQAISKNSQISTIKIAKKDDINQDIDFNTEGTNIEFVKSNNVNAVYKVNEEGLYAVYVKDEKGGSVTKQIYLASSKTPINIDITNLGNRKVNIKATDAICNIKTIKVAKSSEISDFDDFETKGESISFNQGKNVSVDYTVPEDGTYIFFVEDEAGYKRMLNERITSKEDTMAITITQDEENPGSLTIKASDTLSDIVELKVATGENIGIDYFENNGVSLPITQGREVTANYQVQENCVLNVYIKDADGYSYMTKKTIIVGNKPVQNQPPQITLSQNQNNPKQIDVLVSDPDSYIDTIKWAAGSHNADYFKSNGTKIGQGELGKIITTEFLINSTGTYTVYAEDEEGASTVKEINILNIDEVQKPDTTAPAISGVANNSIYRNSVTPNVTDEHLASVVLTRNGEIVSNYQNESEISDEGNYILTARDETGNETSIKFTIDFTSPEIQILQENTDNKNVAVTINLTDNLTGIDILKVANGEQGTSYFEKNGQQISIIKNGTSAIGKINVTENGTYTAYVKDSAGNTKVQTFKIFTIEDEQEPQPNPDITAPTINIEKEIAQDKKSVILTINVADTQSQIKEVKIENGERDISYFDGNGTELKIQKEDKKSTSVVNITQNGTYTIYAEDEAKNKEVKVVTITEIENEEPLPEPEPDTTPPTITGVENGRTYRNYVTPNISDENLSEVVLTRNGNIVEGYKNGDQIKENGNYILTAVDDAGNRTEISFTINIEDENDKPNSNDTNTNSNTNNNESNTNNNTNNGNTDTNTGDNTNTEGNNTNNGVGNTNTNGNTNNNIQNGTNNISGSNNGISSGNSSSASNSQSSNTASNRLPYTGTRNIIIIAIVSLLGIATYCYIKYRKL